MEEIVLLAPRMLRSTLKSHRMLAQKQLVGWMNLGTRRECRQAEPEKGSKPLHTCHPIMNTTMCSLEQRSGRAGCRQAIFSAEVGKAIPHFAAQLRIKLYDSSRSVEHFYGRNEEIGLITVEGL
jgi:hypothetical protein